MNIVIGKRPPEKPQRTDYLNYQKLGFWATVTEVNSKTNTCTVLTSNKEVIRNIPVATTKEWISDESQERNLPPIGSFVFIIMPDNCISNAFILCSGYPKGEVSLQVLYAKDDGEKKTKDFEREIVTPGHWNEKEDYKSGSRTITSPDKKISISCLLKEKETKSLTINAFDKKITITEEGLSIETKAEIKISSESDISIDSKSNININSKGNVEVSVDGAASLSASSFNFNDGALEISG